MSKKLLVGSVMVGIMLATSAFGALSPNNQRDICLAIDGSGSIDDADFITMLNANADAIEDASIVPHDGSVAITVVQFGDTAHLEVSRTVITDQTASQVADAIRNINKDDGNTAMAEGINLCVQNMNMNTNKQIIDISTDGEPDSLQNTIQAADDAVQAGVDAINAIGIGNGVDVNQLNQIVRPQPASQIPDDGFVVLANDYNEYIIRLKEKLRVEAGGAPSVSVPFGPFGKVLMILGLFAIGLVKLRRK